MKRKKKGLIKSVALVLAILTAVSGISLIFSNFGGGTSSSGNANVIEKNHVTKALSAVKYVAFGDSITYGVDGVDWVKMEKPYPTLVAERLGFASVDNRGVSGAMLAPRSTGYCNMTQNILSFSLPADIISVMLGVNDYMQNTPLGNMASRDNTTIYGSLHLIAEHLTKQYPDAFIFFMTPFETKNGTNNNVAGYNLEAVALAVKSVANKYEIPVLDMYENGKYSVEMNNSNSDGLHPSQSFHINYTAPKICKFIKKNY